MDPKQQISQLDPKVKEAYDRVMNAAVTPTPIAPLPIQQTPTIVIGTPQPNTLRREPEKIHIGSTPHASTVPKKRSGVSPVIYILGGFVFLVVYTIFWLKFFNVPVPFLP